MNIWKSFYKRFRTLAIVCGVLVTCACPLMASADTGSTAGTGDDFGPSFLITLLIVSALGLAGGFIRGRKKNKDK